MLYSINIYAIHVEKNTSRSFLSNDVTISNVVELLIAKIVWLSLDMSFMSLSGMSINVQHPLIKKLYVLNR